MFNSEKDVKDYYPLPPGYSVRRATDEDIRKLDYTITIPTGIGIIFGLSVVAIPIFSMLIQSSLQNWEHMQAAMQLETGTRKSTPSFQDWYQIIFAYLGLDKWFLGLITGLGIVRSIYLFIKSLFPKSEQSYQCWIATYNSRIIGQAILQEKQNYSLLVYVSIDSDYW